MRKRPSPALLVGLPPLVVALDQISKEWVLGNMGLHESIPVVPGLFSITSVRNPGAAFGLFSNSGPELRTAFLAGVSVLAVVLLTIYYLRSAPHERVPRLAAALVIGGAVGNLIDRLRFGHVVDFLDIYVGRHHWPAFNVADSAITVGITLFVLSAWRDGDRPADGADAPAPDRRRA
ncbi:MAG: signal peptidase II [Nitrospirae bacterium]|nr:signal peptidase II [Nitrospirota bacterium]